MVVLSWVPISYGFSLQFAGKILAFLEVQRGTQLSQEPSDGCSAEMKRQANFATPRRSPQAGFSLVELAVSLTVILIISAVAIPVIVRTLRVYQLNSTASQLSGMLKFTRFEAIRKNSNVRCQIVQSGSDWLVWADSNGNGVRDGAEPAMVVTGSDTLLPAASVPSPAPIIASLGPGISAFSWTVLSGANSSVTYDNRGAVFHTGTVTVYALYLGSAGGSRVGYRAIVILPSGAIQVWTATVGGTWQRVS